MDKQFLFETLLFFQRRPCYYSFYREGAAIVGEPVPHHYYAGISFPVFRAIQTGEGWQIRDTDDAAFVHQIQEELKKFASYILV
jgi:hypothetical protein